MSPGLWLTPQQCRPLIIPLLPTNPPPFSLPPYDSHATPTPRWLGCQELRCMGLCREPPPLLSSASENKMFCSLSPPLPLPPPHRSGASPSASQWSRSCQKLRPTATLRFALFFFPPSNSDRNLLCPRKLMPFEACYFSKGSEGSL